MTSSRKIGKYEVDSELARGGMGVVHLAHQPVLERRVVLKSVRRELLDEDTIEERFLREARAAAAVSHPNVVGVYDCFTWRGELYIAQEYVDGVDAATLLERLGPLEPAFVARLGLEIARGLEEVHGRGLVHRDLKPDNILVGRAGEVKVADFGIAFDGQACNLTQTGHALGTPAYMAPEQMLGARVDFRSDVFALGVLLYELLTGEGPFEGDDPSGEGRVRRIEAGRYPPLRRRAPRASRRLARIVKRCLRARPARRFASTTELRRALERCVPAASPADVRGEIAAWLAARDAFPSRRRKTRVADPGSEAASEALTPRRWRWALAALLAGLLLAGWQWESSPRLSDWAERVSALRASAAEAGSTPEPGLRAASQ